MNKLFDLSGRVSLVTGGNGGLGLAMAEGPGRRHMCRCNPRIPNYRYGL